MWREAAGRRIEGGRRGPARLRADARPRRPRCGRRLEPRVADHARCSGISKPAASRSCSGRTAELAARADAARRAIAIGRRDPSVERFCRRRSPTRSSCPSAPPYFDPKSGTAGPAADRRLPPDPGYFRDDAPLCELILDDAGRRELDALWQEFDFVTGAPMRQYTNFIFFERAEPPRFMREARVRLRPRRGQGRDVRGQDEAARRRSTWPRPARRGRATQALEAIETYFATISAQHPPGRAGPARRRAEPSRGARRRSPSGPIAGRCRRRSATICSRSIASSASQDGLSHEDAVRDTVVSVLLSPHFCYRVDLAGAGRGRPAAVGLRPGQPPELFPLVEHARRRAAGPRRRRRPAPARGARRRRPGGCSATTGSAAWPPSSAATGSTSAGSRSTTASIASGSRRFNDELRQAMFEEPIRFFVDVVQQRSARCSTCSTASTRSSTRSWPGTTACPTAGVRAGRAGCGSTTRGDTAAAGCLPMAVFLTKNSPGLRTSPVKRGYWVVRRLLGENIPAPPPNVPELPKRRGEAGRADAAADSWPATAPTRAARAATSGSTRSAWRSRATARSASAATRRPRRPARRHPGHLPRRQRRGRASTACAPTSPSSASEEFVDNLCRKLLAYALGRSLLPSDDDDHRGDARRGSRPTDDRFGGLVETIVTSPQFLNKRVDSDTRRRNRRP